MKKNDLPDCARCSLTRAERICINRKGKVSRGCPTAKGKKLLEQAKSLYENSAIQEFARQASIQESECYAERDQQPYIIHPIKTRMEEIIAFAKKMGYIRLGLVFCVGLAREARIVSDLLERQGFELVSVICKIGSVPKETIGVREHEKIFIGEHEAMCNPIAQAMIVNDSKVQFNVLLGLCVGHDSLFFKYAEAPTTVLAVKDRVTGHNPLAAVYLLDSYYARLKTEI